MIALMDSHRSSAACACTTVPIGRNTRWAHGQTDTPLAEAQMDPQNHWLVEDNPLPKGAIDFSGSHGVITFIGP